MSKKLFSAVILGAALFVSFGCAPLFQGSHAIAQEVVSAGGMVAKQASSPPTSATSIATTAAQQGVPVAQELLEKKHEQPLSELRPVRENLLQSAGRTLGEQPETNFVLDVPEHIFAGQPFIVNVAGQGLKQMTVLWQDMQITVQAGQDGQAQNSCKVALATALDEQSKSIPLRIFLVWEDRQETMFADLPRFAKKYAEQRLKVEQKFVTPDPAAAKKSQQDRLNFLAATSKITPHKYWELPLQRPVPGNLSSTYGLRRFFNDAPRQPHKGLDFRAKQGDPIAAMASGNVVLVEEHYYGGNTVIIDHGLGVFSAYLHLSKFQVELGQFVERGQTIGLIGQTGRVTGPHLHLSLVILGQNIDPTAFLGL